MDVEHRQKNTLWKKRAKKTPHVDIIQREKKKKVCGEKHIMWDTIQRVQQLPRDLTFQKKKMHSTPKKTPLSWIYCSACSSCREISMQSTCHNSPTVSNTQKKKKKKKYPRNFDAVHLPQFPNSQYHCLYIYKLKIYQYIHVQ